MSVGGQVVETVVLADRVWVGTREAEYPNDEPCGIYVERSFITRTIGPGDGVWWQGDFAYWTPRNRAFQDMKLRRIGFSGVPRPRTTETE